MINDERKALGRDTNHVHAGTRQSSLENPRQNVQVDEIGWRLWGRVPKRLWNALEDGWKASHKRSDEECSPGSLRPSQKNIFIFYLYIYIYIFYIWKVCFVNKRPKERWLPRWGLYWAFDLFIHRSRRERSRMMDSSYTFVSFYFEAVYKIIPKLSIILSEGYKRKSLIKKFKTSYRSIFIDWAIWLHFIST